MRWQSQTGALASGAAILVASAMTACSGGEAPSAEIKIGQSTALTGPFSEYGAPAKASVQLAIDEFNKGKACKATVRLIAYDDQLNAEKSQTNVRRLLNDDHVDFLMAPAGSGPTLAVLPLVNSANKIMMNITSQSPQIEEDKDGKAYPNVFSFALPLRVESEFMAAFLGQHYKRIGILGESTPYGQNGIAELKKKIEAKGSTVVDTESYAQGAADLTAQLAKLKQAEVDAIAAIAVGNDAATIRLGMARLDMLSTPFVIPNGGGTLPYQQRAKDLVKGTIVVEYGTYTGEKPRSDPAKRFAEMYKAAYGNDAYYGPGEWPIPSFGLTPTSAYDAASVLLQAIKAANCSADTAKVQAQLVSGAKFEGARGFYKFSNAEPHNGVTADQLQMDVYDVGADGKVSLKPFAKS